MKGKTFEPRYDLHTEVISEMHEVLSNAGKLIYKMGDIPKPNLVELINVFIGSGLNIRNKKWLDARPVNKEA